MSDAQIGALSVEVSALVGRANAGVANAASLRLRFRAPAKGTLHVAPVIVAPTGATVGAHRPDLACFRPQTERARANIVRLPDGRARDVVWLQFEWSAGSAQTEVSAKKRPT